MTDEATDPEAKSGVGADGLAARLQAFATEIRKYWDGLSDPDLQDDDFRAAIDLLREAAAALAERIPPREPTDDARDAKRYRWLRDIGDETWTPFNEREHWNETRADDYIDAKIAAAKEGA